MVQTAERNRIRPIDGIPIPARHKIEMQPYLNTWRKYHGKSAMTISSQRGCPYTCKWCSTAVYGQSYRRRSPKVVVDEIQYIKEKYNPDSLWFVDDVFTVSHKWLKEFRDLIVYQNISIDYGIMEKSDNVYVMQPDFGWSDLGTWGALYDYSDKDANNNDYSLDKEVTLKLYSAEEALSIGLVKKSNKVGILIVIAIVIVGIIAYRIIRKRRKKK